MCNRYFLIRTRLNSFSILFYEKICSNFFQYAEADGLRILAFPCNQFGGQEPGDNEEIKAFAAAKGATFDMVCFLQYRFLKQ